MSDCQCTGPGWCERHQIKKSPHWVHLCQTNERYWQAWEEGRGPGQLKRIGEDRKDDSPCGPGTWLSQLMGCGGLPRTYRHAMDSWGPDGCVTRADTIIGWLVPGGACCRSITPVAAQRLLRLAIERSRRAR